LIDFVFLSINDKNSLEIFSYFKKKTKTAKQQEAFQFSFISKLLNLMHR